VYTLTVRNIQGVYCASRQMAAFLLISSLTGTRRMPGSFFDTNVLIHLAAIR
jgi:hypothetical protein